MCDFKEFQKNVNTKLEEGFQNVETERNIEIMLEIQQKMDEYFEKISKPDITSDEKYKYDDEILLILKKMQREKLG